MSGLTKIIERIGQDSAAKCDTIIQEAQAEATDMKKAATEKAEADKAAALEKAKKEAKSIVDMAASGATQEAKKQILATKVHIIDKAIDSALTKLKSLPEEDYFAAIYSLVKANSQEGEGVMYLSSKDVARLPADFDAKVNEAAKGTIVVSKEAKEISEGFVLVYGEVEINCTFEALIDDAKDDLKDELYTIIFA